LSFMLPAVAITSVFAWLYYEFGSLPDVKAFIFGIKPAVIAIIITAMIPLGKKALKSVQLGILGVLTLAACLLGLSEITAMFACGLLGIVLYIARKKYKSTHFFAPLVILTAGTSVPVVKIFWLFLKVGAILYGSGYVLFAFLDAELVGRELITRQELLDAIAVGQLTPGPILSSATFIGWQMGGFWGAMAATAGIFLPSFIFVALLNPVIPKLRRSGLMSAFLDAVNIASVAVILAVAVAMGRETLLDWRTIVIAAVSLAAMLVFRKLNSAWIVVGGAITGYLLLLI
jgi:chromate transporter